MCSLLQLPNKVICNYNKASFWEERQRDVGFLRELVIRCNAILSTGTYYYLLAASVKWTDGFSPVQRGCVPAAVLASSLREADTSLASGTGGLRETEPYLQDKVLPSASFVEKVIFGISGVTHLVLTLIKRHYGWNVKVLLQDYHKYHFGQVLRKICQMPRYPVISYSSPML